MEAEWLLDKKVEVGHAWGPTKWGGIFGFDPYWPIPIVSHSYIPISREKGQQIPIPIQAPEIPRNSSLNHVKSPSIPHNMVPIWSPSPKFWARHMHARVQRLQADWDRRSRAETWNLPWIFGPGIPKNQKSPWIFPTIGIH